MAGTRSQLWVWEFISAFWIPSRTETLFSVFKLKGLLRHLGFQKETPQREHARAQTTEEKNETLKTQGESGERQSKVIEACAWLTQLRSTLFILTGEAPVLPVIDTFKTHARKTGCACCLATQKSFTLGRVEKARRGRSQIFCESDIS